MAAHNRTFEYGTFEYGLGRYTFRFFWLCSWQRLQLDCGL